MYSDYDLSLPNRALRKQQQLKFKARILVLLAELSIRVGGLKRTACILFFFTKKRKHPDQRSTGAIIDRYCTIFNQIKQSRRLKGRCLSQSLVMRYLLIEEGVTAELKIGVNRRNGQFDAHAWLEKEGNLLNDHPCVIADYFVLPMDKLKKMPKFK